MREKQMQSSTSSTLLSRLSLYTNPLLSEDATQHLAEAEKLERKLLFTPCPELEKDIYDLIAKHPSVFSSVMTFIAILNKVRLSLSQSALYALITTDQRDEKMREQILVTRFNKLTTIIRELEIHQLGHNPMNIMPIISRLDMLDETLLNLKSIHKLKRAHLSQYDLRHIYITLGLNTGDYTSYSPQAGTMAPDSEDYWKNIQAKWPKNSFGHAQILLNFPPQFAKDLDNFCQSEATFPDQINGEQCCYINCKLLTADPAIEFPQIHLIPRTTTEEHIELCEFVGLIRYRSLPKRLSIAPSDVSFTQLNEWLKAWLEPLVEVFDLMKKLNINPLSRIQTLVKMTSPEDIANFGNRLKNVTFFSSLHPRAGRSSVLFQLFIHSTLFDRQVLRLPLRLAGINLKERGVSSHHHSDLSRTG